MPPEVHRRNVDNFTSIEGEGKPRTRDEVREGGHALSGPHLQAHERRKDLNDIMRFSVREFVAYADDPETDYLYLDPETGS